MKLNRRGPGFALAVRPEACATSSQPPVPTALFQPLAKTNELLWVSWSVPHIFARDEASSL